MNAPADVTRAPGVLRPDYRLADGLWAQRGTVFLSGTQALVRLMAMQRERDAAAGLATQGFISGYRGSPLGMVDLAVWKAGSRFTDAGPQAVGKAVVGAQHAGGFGGDAHGGIVVSHCE